MQQHKGTKNVGLMCLMHHLIQLEPCSGTSRFYTIIVIACDQSNCLPGFFLQVIDRLGDTCSCSCSIFAETLRESQTQLSPKPDEASPKSATEPENGDRDQDDDSAASVPGELIIAVITTGMVE